MLSPPVFLLRVVLYSPYCLEEEFSEIGAVFMCSPWGERDIADTTAPGVGAPGAGLSLCAAPLAVCSVVGPNRSDYPKLLLTKAELAFKIG